MVTLSESFGMSGEETVSTAEGRRSDLSVRTPGARHGSCCAMPSLRRLPIEMIEGVRLSLAGISAQQVALVIEGGRAGTTAGGHGLRKVLSQPLIVQALPERQSVQPWSESETNHGGDQFLALGSASDASVGEGVAAGQVSVAAVLVIPWTPPSAVSGRVGRGIWTWIVVGSGNGYRAIARGISENGCDDDGMIRVGREGSVAAAFSNQTLSSGPGRVETDCGPFLTSCGDDGWETGCCLCAFWRQERRVHGCGSVETTCLRGRRDAPCWPDSVG